MPLVSIIVPVYNREHTLDFCIGGILKSNAKDFELLLIDDGSTDNSLNVCQKYAQEDNRIKVFQKENGGVSSARNLGLDNAKGEWILFVDSDDSIFQDCLDIISVARMEFKDMNPQLIQFQSHKSAINCEPINHKNNKTNHCFFSNEELIKHYFTDFKPYNNDFYFIHDKFFLNKVIQKRGIRFLNDVSLGEDQIFVCEYLIAAESMFITTAVGRATFAFDKWHRTYGLGGMLRTPEDFFHCQKENYKALKNLYEHSKCEPVKIYANNYMIDRAITRILWRYSLKANRAKYPYEKLKSFFSDIVVPYFKTIDVNDDEIRSKNVKRIYKLLINNDFSSAYRLSSRIETINNLKIFVKKCGGKMLRKLGIK